MRADAVGNGDIFVEGKIIMDYDLPALPSGRVAYFIAHKTRLIVIEK